MFFVHNQHPSRRLAKNRVELTAQEALDVARVIDTPSQFTILAKIVDSNAKSLLFSSTLGILEEGLCIAAI